MVTYIASSRQKLWPLVMSISHRQLIHQKERLACSYLYVTVSFNYSQMLIMFYQSGFKHCLILSFSFFFSCRTGTITTQNSTWLQLKKLCGNYIRIVKCFSSIIALESWLTSMYIGTAQVQVYSFQLKSLQPQLFGLFMSKLLTTKASASMPQPSYIYPSNLYIHM